MERSQLFKRKHRPTLIKYSVITVGHGSRTGQGSSLTIDGTLKLQNLELPSSVVNVGIDSHLKTSGLVIENCTQASYNLIQAIAPPIRGRYPSQIHPAHRGQPLRRFSGSRNSGRRYFCNWFRAIHKSACNLDSTVEFTSSAGISVIGDEANPLVFTGRRLSSDQARTTRCFPCNGPDCRQERKVGALSHSTDITSGLWSRTRFP